MLEFAADIVLVCSISLALLFDVSPSPWRWLTGLLTSLTTDVKPYRCLAAADDLAAVAERTSLVNPFKWRSHTYRQVSNIRHTLAGYKIVDHSDVVGASPVGAAPTTSSFST